MSEELKTKEGFTYSQLRDAGWSDDALLNHPEYHVVVPKNENASPPTPPPSPPPAPNEDSPPAVEETDFDPAVFDNPMNDLEDDFNAFDQTTEADDSVEETNVEAIQINENKYEPDSVQKIIGQVSPADFDNMIKILTLLKKEKTVDAITIKDSKILQGTSNYIIEADMTKILQHDGNTISFDILDPKTYVDLFKEFRSSNDIFILDDPENKRYLLTNGEIRLQLPKKITDGENSDTSIKNIDISQLTPFCKRKIDKEERGMIKNLSKNTSYIEYLIQDNLLKAMNIPDFAVYTFTDYINDKNAKKLDETNSDLTLRTASFLPIDAESYDVEIFKKDDKYVSITRCKIGGQIDVTISEFCDDTTGGGLTLI